MSRYGFASWDERGTLLNYSPFMNSQVFNTSLNVQYSQDIPSESLSVAGGIVTPLRTSYYFYRYYDFTTSIAGRLSADGSKYYQPKIGVTHKQYTWGALYEWVKSYEVNPIKAAVHSFGQPPISTDDWGIEATSFGGGVAISQNYKAMYVHPNKDGRVVREAIAGSLYAPTPSSNNTSDSFAWGQPEPGNGSMNIFFDKAYNNPPLIYITSSEGWVAFNGMVQDSGGRFIGASIVSNNKWHQYSSDDLIGWAPYLSDPCKFEYYIVSDERPVYSESGNYGMQVLDKTENVVFDSRYRVPVFSKVTVKEPYIESESTKHHYDSIRWKYREGYSFNKDYRQGVLINNCPCVKGFLRYTTWVINGKRMGPTIPYGGFLRVYPDKVYSQAQGTTGNFTVHAGAITIDFHRPGSDLTLYMSQYAY